MLTCVQSGCGCVICARSWRTVVADLIFAAGVALLWWGGIAAVAFIVWAVTS